MVSGGTLKVTNGRDASVPRREKQDSNSQLKDLKDQLETQQYFTVTPHPFLGSPSLRQSCIIFLFFFSDVETVLIWT